MNWTDLVSGYTPITHWRRRVCIQCKHSVISCNNTGLMAVCWQKLLLQARKDTKETVSIIHCKWVTGHSNSVIILSCGWGLIDPKLCVLFWAMIIFCIMLFWFRYCLISFIAKPRTSLRQPDLRGRVGRGGGRGGGHGDTRTGSMRDAQPDGKGGRPHNTPPNTPTRKPSLPSERWKTQKKKKPVNWSW